MDSDSESQDSDDGRRFRFETTRKDGQSRRRVSPERNKRRSRSRSKDRNSRDDKTLRRSRDISSSRRGRSSEERKDRKEGSSRRQQDKDHRSHRTKDYRVGGAAPGGGAGGGGVGGGAGGGGAAGVGESKNGREHRHKSKREKHKRRSRDRSSERSRGSEEYERKREDKGSRSQSPSSEQQQPAAVERPVKPVAKSEDEKVIADEKANGSSGSSSNPIAVVSDVMLTASTVTAAALSPPVRKKPKKSFFDRVVNKGAIEDDATYGPALPPQLEKKWYEARETVNNVRVNESSEVIGPALPASLKLLSVQKDVDQYKEEEEEMVIEENEEEDNEYEADAFGPALPPHMERRSVVGPMLPADFVVPQNTDNTVDIPKPDENDDEDNDDDDNIGPLPANHPSAKNSYVQMQLEYRALKVKEKFMDKTGPEKNKREEWMTELPPAHAVAIGLGSLPRKFKTREGPDMSDRSIWTDTPADKLRKQKEKEENRFVPSEDTSKKSKKSSETVYEDRKEPESLLDMHLKNMKKKKKKAEKEAKESGLPTRRPFDRDTDLQVNRLDNAKKKKIFDKARMLNDRFAPGKI